LELTEGSGRESAVVSLGEDFIPLPKFVGTQRELAVRTLLELEADIFKSLMAPRLI
jgi:hypothetical protein